jgi:hypothetical protein
MPIPVHDFLLRNHVDHVKKLRVEEYCIKPKDFVFVLGTLSQNPGIDASITPVYAERVNKRHSPPPKKAAASESPQQVIRLSGEATALPVTKMTQQQKIAAALMRAGMHNRTVWSSVSEPSHGNVPLSLGAGAAQEASAGSASGSSSTREGISGVISSSKLATSVTQAAQVLEEAEPNEHEAFDLHPPVVLMKGTKEPAFFISWRSQRDVVQGLVWKSRLLFWSGPALMLVSLYFLFLTLHQR